MSRRLATKAQGCPQVHRRDPYKNPGACGPCGQRLPLWSGGKWEYEYGRLAGSARIPLRLERLERTRAPARLNR